MKLTDHPNLIATPTRLLGALMNRLKSDINAHSQHARRTPIEPDPQQPQSLEFFRGK